MKIVASLAAGMLALAAASAAQAAGLLDQSNPGGSAGLNGVGHRWQQEVTAGVGGRLTGIMLWGEGAMRVRIAEGDAFSAGPFAFSQLVAFEANSPAGLFIDTRAANIILSAGETFVIDLTEGTEGYTASITPYAGGDLWLAGGGWPTTFDFTERFGTSLAFETYMGAVPEPGAWALMIVGLGLAGAGVRRKRSVAAG